MPSKAVNKAKQKSLGELLRKAKAEAATKPRKLHIAQPSLSFTTVSLTPMAKEILDSLADQATKRTGRKVSASSVIRALLHLATEQHLAETIVTAIETEMNTGAVIWGRARQD